MTTASTSGKKADTKWLNRNNGWQKQVASHCRMSKASSQCAHRNVKPTGIKNEEEKDGKEKNSKNFRITNHMINFIE